MALLRADTLDWIHFEIHNSLDSTPADGVLQGPVRVFYILLIASPRESNIPPARCSRTVNIFARYLSGPVRVSVLRNFNIAIAKGIVSRYKRPANRIWGCTIAAAIAIT